MRGGWAGCRGRLGDCEADAGMGVVSGGWKLGGLPSSFNFQKYIIKAGATPKLIMSVKESNSFPTFDVPLINLAILPSSPSITAAIIIAIIANSYLPSKANLIEVRPIQTPISVSMLGKITLALLFSGTILKFFLGCCISIFWLIEFPLK